MTYIRRKEKKIEKKKEYIYKETLSFVNPIEIIWGIKEFLKHNQKKKI